MRMINPKNISNVNMKGLFGENTGTFFQTIIIIWNDLPYLHLNTLLGFLIIKFGSVDSEKLYISRSLSSYSGSNSFS